ncbi:MAG: hypothetical protein ACRDND_07245 [Streptosporangiaceae bacterium]
MSPVWDIVLWTAIPVALLLPALIFGVYWFSQRPPRAPELPVERAYRKATAR